MELTNLPDWFGAAVIGALLAALGYVGKQIAEGLLELRKRRNLRRARLVELLALIRAGDTAFRVQSEKCRELRARILERDPASSELSYDRLFAGAFPTLPPRDREQHDLIRAYTVHTFRPLNEALLAWLKADTDFRVWRDGTSPRSRLARYLADLEAHLLLWQAKYVAWIPDHPERALVFLGDEERHGTGFPKGGAEIVKGVL